MQAVGRLLNSGYETTQPMYVKNNANNWDFNIWEGPVPVSLAFGAEGEAATSIFYNIGE